jgi:hypothetical protein
MLEMWSYDKVKRIDKKGGRWHFVTRDLFVDGDEDQPREYYFRNDQKTEFGMLRFERVKDNPYRDYEMLINKIMNNMPFRKSLHSPETEAIWKKNWK